MELTNPPDLLILCGGQGTRLRSVVSDRPKPLAMIGDRPFIEFVIALFVRQGVRRVILCTGYLGHQFEDWYADRAFPYQLMLSQETMPLGTAGAIRHASRWITSRTVIVANGDSLCEIDVRRLLACHAEKHAQATLVLTEDDDRRDVGVVTMDRQQRITAFHEKRANRAVGFHNAGVYVFERSVIERIPTCVPCSLEFDWVPTLIPLGIYGVISKGPLYDIGTPERLTKFQAVTDCSDSRSDIRSSIRSVACT